jgi:hypothetical protein
MGEKSPVRKYLRRGINNTGHTILAMADLRAVEPDRIGVRHGNGKRSRLQDQLVSTINPF